MGRSGGKEKERAREESDFSQAKPQCGPGLVCTPARGSRDGVSPPAGAKAHSSVPRAGTGLKTSHHRGWHGGCSPLTMLSVALSQGLRLRYFRWRSCKQTVQEAEFKAQKADLGFGNQGRSSVPQDAPTPPYTQPEGTSCGNNHFFFIIIFLFFEVNGI